MSLSGFFASFMLLLITAMLGVIGYFWRKQDTENKEWRKATDAKIDTYHTSVMAALKDYVPREQHLEVHKTIRKRIDEHANRLSELERAVFHGGER